MTPISTVDLFAGAGGLSLGFRMADRGYEPLFAVELEEAAARTFKRNFDSNVRAGSIEDVHDFPEADVVIGGPPCQGFSPLGRDRDEVSRTHLNQLWRKYIKAVKQIKPRAFVIENVPQFQRSPQFVELLTKMESDDWLRGYSYEFGVLDAADYGVAQHRKRGVLLAVRDISAVPWPPPPTHGLPGLPDHRTVRDEIWNLFPRMPERTGIDFDDEGGQYLHFRRNPSPISIERYKVIPEGGNRFDLARERPDLLPRCWKNKPTGTTDGMGRLWWDKPSGTIRTEFYKPEKGRYLHPEANRAITHREAARLQSFPDEFIFEGTKIEVGRQIGNAVPPLLGKAIAEHLYRIAFSD